MQSEIRKAAEAIRKAGFVAALTGAGISVESGIPPFRGPGSLWDKIDPVEFAHIRSFLKNPARVWDVLLREMKRVLDTATPNPAHIALADLEKLAVPCTIITQNVDGLHQTAGSTDVVEFHGNFATVRCQSCDRQMPMKEMSLATLPPKCQDCGGIFRPDCVFFGESIPMTALQISEEAARQCDVMLVIGTSAVVQPAASIPLLAKSAGARIIEVNPEPTPLTRHVSDIFLQGRAAHVMTELIRAVRDEMPERA